MVGGWLSPGLADSPTLDIDLPNLVSRESALKLISFGGIHARGDRRPNRARRLCK
jgi:hypothetical protein